VGGVRSSVRQSTERVREVAALGGVVTLRGSGADVAGALSLAEAILRGLHATLTRFDPDSELCRLNADPRTEVPASALVRRLAAAVPYAGALSGGLVDATVAPALMAPARSEVALDVAALGDAPRPATPDPRRRWAQVSADDRCVRRAPGIEIDSGGLGKGLAADVVAERLRGLESFAVDCLGDVRVGGAERIVVVAGPFGAEPVAELRVTGGAMATSGITRRWWRAPDGRPVHHLVDPGTGLPAWTGIVQATALAPTALEAEVRAKAALLAGPEAACEHLPHGGVLVLAGGDVITAPASSP
jgi:FAD:protein FMN transferase